MSLKGYNSEDSNNTTKRERESGSENQSETEWRERIMARKSQDDLKIS
jgi:hypothetical protein